MTQRPCKRCGNQILLATNQHTGLVVALDVVSRKHLFELSDSSDEPSAFSVADREVYLDHALNCAGRPAFAGGPR